MNYDELMSYVKREVEPRKHQWSLSFEANHWEEPDFDYDIMQTVTDGTVREVKVRINGHETVIHIDHDTQDYAPVAEWLAARTEGR